MVTTLNGDDMEPWEEGPDKEIFEYNGYTCVIIRHSTMKHLCGYIGVEKDSPLWDKSYNELSFLSVHGGLTFSQHGDGHKLPEGKYWFGFDCAHGGDYIPSISERGSGTYKDREFVKQQLILLTYDIQELETLLNKAIINETAINETNHN